jgi:hypothetical protein
MTGANAIDAAYRVSERGQAEQVDGVLLDLMSAHAIVAVHRALSPANQAKYETVSVTRAAEIAWRLVK